MEKDSRQDEAMYKDMEVEGKKKKNSIKYSGIWAQYDWTKKCK